MKLLITFVIFLASLNPLTCQKFYLTNDEYNEVKVAIKNLRSEVHDLRAIRERQRLVIDSLRSENEILATKLDLITKENEDLRFRNRFLEEYADDLENQVAGLRGTIVKRDSQIRNLKDLIARLKARDYKKLKRNQLGWKPNKRKFIALGISTAILFAIQLTIMSGALK